MFKNELFKSYINGLYHLQIKAKLKKGKERKYMYKAPFLGVQDAHKRIYEMIESDKPMMVARFGFTEAQVLGMYFMQKEKMSIGYGACAKWLYNTAGFFSEKKYSKQDLDLFCELMIEDSKQVDLIGASYALLEDYVINNCCINAQLTEFNNLRIMVAHPSWGGALRNKKVLVIHPFAETIENQYRKRAQIWGNRANDILPNFTLKTYKAIQTIAGNNTNMYKNWFSALEIMKSDIKKIDFDIALIGCGAYGFPLAAECKRMKKKAIHLGGQVQMCFGITGRRWDVIPYYKKFVNEAWVHPSDEDKPKNFKKIENGCYW